MNCEKAARKSEKKKIQQNQGLMRAGMRKISTTEMSPGAVSQPFFAISTGYTTTTLYHF
ncbi:hypothetical protein L0222_08785 [bacterium]|nr:hypothetical protein [bacterium]MCI0601475.1 hypothetical protein [bacterium]